jgi:hypothetical protein
MQSQSKPSPIQKSVGRKAILSFDGMFSIIPMLFILTITLSAANFLTKSSLERMDRQQTFDKLVSIADRVVKQDGVMTECIGTDFGGCENARRPNWIDRSKINEALSDELEKKANLHALSISLDDPITDSSSICIYRIVVVDSNQEITKLYVCGG